MRIVRSRRSARQVRGRQCDAQIAGGQHHDHLATDAVGKEFGVAAEGEAGIGEDRFLHRRGDDGIEHAALGTVRSRGEHGDDGLGVRDIQTVELRGSC